MFLPRRKLILIVLIMLIILILGAELWTILNGRKSTGTSFNASKQDYLLLQHTAHSLNYVNKLFNQTINDEVFLKEQRNGQPPSLNMRTHKKGSFTPTCPPNLFLLILIPIRRTSSAARQAIRKSWGNFDNQINQLYLEKHDSSRNGDFTWKTIFVVGNSIGNTEENQLLEKERWLHKDILKLRVPDGYRYIQRKVVTALTWASKRCTCTFVLKTDDDVFLNIHRVLPWLQHILKKNILYAGSVSIGAPVIRDPNHDNFVSVEDHPRSTYTPYCSGGGYFLAGKLLKNLTQAAKSIPPINNEDAYIGMVVYSLGVQPYEEKRILPYLEASLDESFLHTFGVCHWIDQFVMHGVKPTSHVIMHWNAVTALSIRTLCMFKKRNNII